MTYYEVNTSVMKSGPRLHIQSLGYEAASVTVTQCHGDSEATRPGTRMRHVTVMVTVTAGRDRHTRSGNSQHEP